LTGRKNKPGNKLYLDKQNCMTRKLFIIISLLLTANRNAAQPPVGKCISGDCINGQGVYQLNSFSFYKGGFLNGKFNGEGSIYNPNQWTYTGLFSNGKIEQLRYTGKVNTDTTIQLLFAGKAHLTFYPADEVKANWQKQNFSECNGNYFVLHKDSGRLYNIRNPYDSTRYSFSGRINSEGKLYGIGKIYKGDQVADYDFGTGYYTFDTEGLSRLANNHFAHATADVSNFKCISGDCVNGKGIFQLNKFARYEGGFKNGKMHGPGKLGWEKDNWHITGNFQGNMILNYHYYEQQKGSPAFVLKRKGTGRIIIYDKAEVQKNWTTNIYYYLNNQFFKLEETDTITWFYKPDFFLKIYPDKKKSILTSGTKKYAFLLTVDPFEITEDMLREHLKRNNYQNKAAYTYDKDIMKKPATPPVANNQNKPGQKDSRLLNASEYAQLAKMMADEFRNQLSGVVIAEGYMEGGNTNVKYKTIYANVAPGEVYAVLAFVKYSAPVTISVPQNNNPFNNITCKGNRITEAGATVHPYTCNYVNLTYETSRVKFEFNVTNSAEPAYFLVIKVK